MSFILRVYICIAMVTHETPELGVL